MNTTRSLTLKYLPTLAAVGCIALFTALGFWQLGRADFKRGLWTDFEQSGRAGARVVTDISTLSGLDRYTPVQVTGTYVRERQIFLDNRINEGRVGVEVFTPLRTPAGVVLVNRGWLNMPRDRSSLPEAPVPAGEVTVRGLSSPPPAVGIELGEVREPESWPWLTPYLRIDDAERVLGRELSDRVILLSPGEPGGFLRDWEPATMAPERHVGYALQWFSLAAAVAIIWLVLTLRRRRRIMGAKPEDKSPESQSPGNQSS